MSIYPIRLAKIRDAFQKFNLYLKRIDFLLSGYNYDSMKYLCSLNEEDYLDIENIVNKNLLNLMEDLSKTKLNKYL